MMMSECRAENITFAEMSNEYIELVKAWVAKPHVRRWWIDSWSEEIFQDTAYEKNESFINGSMIIYINDVPVGLSQMYFSSASPETRLICGECGLRFFIGDIEYLKQKLGGVIIGKLVEGIFRATKIERIVCEPQADNWPAIISLKRAKFRDHGRVRRANFSLIRLSLPRNLVEKKLK
tara:strand:+ start:286 stop:819 length:534 start_codon:yes stop_codon:yes gene_type:complete